jgi:hypothetical protein
MRSTRSAPNRTSGSVWCRRTHPGQAAGPGASTGGSWGYCDGHRFQSGGDPETAMHHHVWSHNRHLPQSAPCSKSPLRAMKDWNKLKQQLFKKPPYCLPGCDSCRPVLPKGAEVAKHCRAYAENANRTTHMNTPTSCGVLLRSPRPIFGVPRFRCPDRPVPPSRPAPSGCGAFRAARFRCGPAGQNSDPPGLSARRHLARDHRPCPWLKPQAAIKLQKVVSGKRHVRRVRFLDWAGPRGP